MPLQNRVDPFGEIHAVECARHVHGQPRRHPRSRHQDLAQAALDDQGVDRLQSASTRARRRELMGRNAPQRQRRLDGAVLPRRGDRAGRRPPALLRLPARGGEGIRALLRRGLRRCRAEGRRDRRAAARGAAGVRRNDRPRIDRQEPRQAAGRRHGLRRRSAYAIARAARLCAWRSRAMTGALGYRRSRRGTTSALVTPPTTLAVLTAGYRPVWHPTSGRAPLDPSARPLPHCLGACAPTTRCSGCSSTHDLAAGATIEPTAAAEPLSGECAAARRRRRAAGLQRPRRRMAGARRRKDQEGGAAGRRRADAAAAAASRSRLLLRAAEAGPARLSRAEGGRDGRRRAAAGDHPAHAGRQDRQRPHRAPMRSRRPSNAASWPFPRCARRSGSTGCWPAGRRIGG